MANSVTAKCRHCGKELPSDHKGPCPYCGKVGKNIIATFTDYVSITASLNVQKVHKYTTKHPRFIFISIALTIASIIVGYLLGALVGFRIVGLLIGIIVAMLNWWLTPHAIETIVEITSWSDKGRGAQEAKLENNAKQQEGYSPEDIYRKLENIENKVDSNSRIQKFGILYALGAAFVILGLSYWPGLLERFGIDTAQFYLVNPVAFIVLGSITIISAYIVSRKKARRQIMGTKGRKNVKKPKQDKAKKAEAQKK